MNFRCLLIFGALVVSISGASVSKPKNHRLGAVWNLNGMTMCKLGVSAYEYNDYGCYCGLGGAGTPVDGIDECCKQHDDCYDKLIKSGACPDVYRLPYSYSCRNHQPYCNPTPDSCKAALCKCDLAIVECWSKFPVPEDKATCPSYFKQVTKTKSPLKIINKQILDAHKEIVGVVKKLFS